MSNYQVGEKETWRCAEKKRLLMAVVVTAMLLIGWMTINRDIVLADDSESEMLIYEGHYYKVFHISLS